MSKRERGGRRGYPGTARAPGSDKWITDKAEDGQVPKCQSPVKITTMVFASMCVLARGGETMASRLI